MEKRINDLPAIPRTEMEKAAAKFNIAKYRFSDAANDVYELNSLEELTNEELLQMIEHHQTEQVPRLDELDDYYEGKNRAIYERKPREPQLSDVRLAHAYARYISTFIQGYLAGNPITIKHPSPDINTKIDDLNNSIKANALNADIILDLSIYGRAYELVYRNSQDKDKVVRLDPLKTFVIYDTSVERLSIAAIRYRINREGRYEVEKYLSDKVEYLIQDNNTLIELKPPEEHYFSDVPITEFTNNRFRQGDFEPVLDLIDAYDFAQSDMSNYMTDLNNAMLVIAGNVNIDVEDAKNMKEKNILLLIPSVDLEGKTLGPVDAKYIYKQYDVTGVEANKKRLQNDIHRFTNTPDMTDEKFSGIASGESMKYKLFGMDQVRADKETKMIEGLHRRYRLLFNLKSTARELVGVDSDDLEFLFTPNIPRAFYEELAAFIDAGGQLSLETLLTLTALVDDPTAEIERIKKEREDSMKEFLDNQGDGDDNESGAEDEGGQRLRQDERGKTSGLDNQSRG